MKRFLTLFTLLTAVFITASAYDFMVDGIAYKKNSDGKSVTVTQGGSKETGSLTIPEKITLSNNITYTVTSIGDRAFIGCTGLTSITIPNSVKSIQESAFSYCSGLTNVTLQDSVMYIERFAFRNCTSLTSITIGNSVRSIGEGAFTYCTHLDKVEFNAVDCFGINDGKIPWFQNCPLTTLKFGDKVKYIPAYLAFQQKYLNSITIPNSVTNIGSYAFNGCKSLTSITIPNSVTNIGYSAFSGCNIREINVSCKDTKDFAKYVQRNDIESIFSFSRFADEKDVKHNIYIDNKKQTEITIPNSVATIGSYAFYNCKDLTLVIIPKSVTSVNNKAFYNCPIEKLEINSESVCQKSYFSNYTGDCKLKELVIGDAVENISASSFSNCPSLKVVTLGNSLRNIGKDAFSECNSIEKINSRNPIPPACADASVFAPYVYNAAVVYVPNERNAIARYKADNIWSKFFEIYEKDFSGIYDIVIDKKPTEDIYYNLHGQRVFNPTPGIYIHNGKKELVR